MVLLSAPLQLYLVVIVPTYVRGGTLDFQMTDVCNLLQVTFVLPLSNADHSITLDSHFDGTGSS